MSLRRGLGAFRYFTLHDSGIKRITLNEEVLLEELMTVLSGTHNALDRMYYVKKKFIGVDLDGVLLLNRRAVEPNLEPGPIFIIREGEFSLNGERRQYIEQSRWYANISTAAPYDFMSDPGDDHEPVEMGMRTVTAEARNWEKERPRIRSSLSVEASLTPSAIRLSYVVKVQYPLAQAGCSDDGGRNSGIGTTHSLVGIGDILNNVQMLRVTAPCPHPPDAPFRVRVHTFDAPGGKRIVWGKDRYGFLWRASGIPDDDETCYEPRGLPSLSIDSLVVFVTLHDVGYDAVAQWLAVANSRAWEEADKMGRICILQRGCCLPCTAKQAREWITVEDRLSLSILTPDRVRRRIRIIAFPA
jgi:hypothetical protein